MIGTPLARQLAPLLWFFLAHARLLCSYVTTVSQYLSCRAPPAVTLPRPPLASTNVVAEFKKVQRVSEEIELLLQKRIL